MESLDPPNSLACRLHFLDILTLDVRDSVLQARTPHVLISQFPAGSRAAACKSHHCPMRPGGAWKGNINEGLC